MITALFGAPNSLEELFRMTLWNYSPEEVQLLIAGVYPVKGFIEGSFISVSKDVAPFSSQKASDGSVGRVYHNNDDYTISVKLMSQSPSNDVFTKLWQLDEITQRAKFPIFIKDSLGNSFFHSTTTWLVGIPPLEFGVGQSQREWVLKSSQGAINIGGNEDASTLLEDINNIVISSLPSLEAVL